MAGFNLGAALATLAPTIADVLGGPLAGAGVTALEGVFGVKPGGGAAAVSQIIQNAAMTPEQVIALRQADDDLRIKLGQQGIDLAKINADAATAADQTAEQDRASARAREVATKDATPRILGGMIILASVALGGAVVSGYTTHDPAAATLVGTVIGYVFGEARQVLAYYFGSSSGSDRKTELLAKATS